MPFKPYDVGAKLETVGDKQIDTGRTLQGYSRKVRSVGTVLRDDSTARRGTPSINQSMDSIEAGTRSVRTLLSPVADTLHGISAGFAAIALPSIDVSYTTFDIPGRWPSAVRDWYWHWVHQALSIYRCEH